VVSKFGHTSGFDTRENERTDNANAHRPSRDVEFAAGLMMMFVCFIAKFSVNEHMAPTIFTVNPREVMNFKALSLHSQ